MIEINITADTSEAVQLLQTADRQLPFAISKALNETANEVQKAQRLEVQQHFTLRHPTFILNTIKIFPQERATKDRLTVVIRIDPDRDFLAKFEAGGEKRPLVGQFLAVPAAIASKHDIIPSSLRPKALQIQPHTTSAGKIQLKGLQGTYIIESGRFSGLFQRKGGVSRLLYAFKKEVPLPASLHFEDTANDVAKDVWEQNFAEAFNFAMETAK